MNLLNGLSAPSLGRKECPKPARHSVGVSLSLSLPDSRPSSSCPGFPCWPHCWGHPQQQHLSTCLPAAERQPAHPWRPADSQPLFSPPSAGCDHSEAARETRCRGSGAGAPPVSSGNATLCSAQLPPPQAEDGAVGVRRGFKRSSFRLQVSG